MKGLEEPNVSGILGAFCEIDSDNFPISRTGPICLKLDSERILIIGGFLTWDGGSSALSRDVWIYNFKKNIWSRMWGDSTTTDGNYGIQGAYDPMNDPPSRYGAVGWLNGNDVWIYGGDRCVNYCAQSDLWKYTIDSSCLNGIYNSIQMNLTSFEIKISPNPTTTLIQLHLPSSLTILSIFNLLGEKVKEQKVTTQEVTMDVSELPAGMYLVKTEKEMVGKFVKK
jgi:hypothetical protein